MFSQVRRFLDNQKNKSLAGNVVAAFIIKGLALVISLFTMPAYMRFFSDREVLGVWFTILSVLTWILSFDLGIGNGLRNNLSAALAINDRKAAKEYISSAYWLIGGIVAVLMLLSLLGVPQIRWNRVLNIEDALIPASDLTLVVQFALVGILLQFFLRIISSICYAMQKSAINNLISLITSSLQLIFVLVAPAREPVANLKMFSIAYVFCSNLPLVVATIIVFAGPLKDCFPRLHDYKHDKARKVISLGGVFFICQILYMIIANTNEFFITQYTNAGNVVDYQVYYRLFSLAGMIMTLATSPVWSAVTKAIAEKDFNWLDKLYSLFKKISLIGIGGEILLIIILQPVINIWLGSEAIEVNYWIAILFASFGSLMLYQSMLSSFVCGMGRMRLQAICYFSGVIAKVLIIHIGIKATGAWEVVVLANIAVLLPYCILQQIDLNHYIKVRIRRS